MTKKQPDAVPAQREEAEKALALKQQSPIPDAKPESRTADEGMRPIENKDAAPSGALDHAGHHPAMQRAKFARQK